MILLVVAVMLGKEMVALGSGDDDNSNSIIISVGIVTRMWSTFPS